MRIWVTGAEGFVGRHVCPALAAAFPGAEILTTRVDVTDRDAVFAFVESSRPDVCLHLAGIAAIGAALMDPARCWAVNLFGTMNVAEAILAAVPDCRMIFISSAEVYGGSFKEGAALDESALLRPMNLYAASKAAAEMALMAAVPKGLRLLRLRPFNHTGAGQSEAFVVPAFAGQIARIEAGLAPPVIHVGALTPERDFLDVRDVAAAYVAAVARFDAIVEVINIASGQGVAVGRVLEMLLAQARVPVEVREDPARLRKVEIARAVGDAGLAARVLGWAPKFGLAETLQTVLAQSRVACAGPPQH
jgi:GDP-4-dehydro-6-deoxy-D-mannose reductase